VYNVDPDTADTLVTLARQARRKDWWSDQLDVVGPAADALQLQHDARMVQAFTLDVVHGLLQTEDYARAVMRAGLPTESAKNIDARVQIRMQQQRRLLDGELELWAVLDEAALWRGTGNAAIMAAQVDRLVELAELPNVSLQVLPLDLPGHAGIGTPFELYTVDRYGRERYVYVDTPTGGLYNDDPLQVENCARTWGRLLGDALSCGKSVPLLAAIADERRSRSEDQRPRRLRVAKGK
jgi:hypothetical protein